MNFEDFKNDPQKLLNNFVLFEQGMSYDSNTYKAIKKIEKITKTGFRISNYSGLFDIHDGYLKGRSIGVITNCKLLTEEEVIKLKVEWTLKKDIKTKKTEIENQIKNLNDIEKINKILDILKG